jgi:hypothetical protein
MCLDVNLLQVDLLDMQALLRLSNPILPGLIATWYMLSRSDMVLRCGQAV